MILEDFMNISLIKGSEILNQRIDFFDTPIRRISILEYPIENFVRPDEIVLSTALVVRDDPTMFRQFITDIYNSKASALALSFPKDVNPLDNEILEYINNLNMPVITLPWDAKFSLIVEQVLHQLWSTENKTRNSLEELQKKLLDSYISGGSLDDAALIISQNLFCNVIISDSNDNERSGSIYNPSEEYNGGKEIHIELRSLDRLYGHLILYGFESTYSTEQNLFMIEKYVQLPLTLWFDKEWVASSVQMQIKDNFIWKLSTSQYSSVDELLENAEDLGFKTDCMYYSIVGRFISSKHSDNDSYSISLMEKRQLKISESKIKQQVIDTASNLGYHIMTTYHDYDLVIYLEAKDNCTLESFLDELDESFKHILPDFICTWGFDSQAEKINNLNSKYKNASLALQTVFSAKIPTYRSSFQSSNSQRFLSLITSIPQIRELSAEILKPLTDYDLEHDSELLMTLAAFCKCNGRINETSREIHLHRQSLLYRLEKIESILDMDLKAHHDFYLLDSCTQILQWK